MLSDKRTQEICKICAKNFNTSEELKFHLKKCGKYQCYKCYLPFLTAAALNSHIIFYHHNSDNNNNSRTFICSQCKKKCSSRRDLYNHRMNQHGRNDDNDPDDIQHYIQYEENENIREVYLTIRNHIMDCYHEGELTYPFTVSNRNSLRLLMNKILRICIIEQARTVRPSTAWTLAFITNVQYNIFLTDFSLGAAVSLRSYITTNRYLKNVFNNRRKNQPCQDNLCFLDVSSYILTIIKKLKTIFECG